MRRKKFLTAILAGVLGTSLIATSAFAYDGFTTYKGSNMVEYYGSYDSVSYPYEQIDATFTKANVTVDGQMDEAYAGSVVSRIDNLKSVDGYGLEPGRETYGELRTLWDGPNLYLMINVYDYCVMTSDKTKPGATTNPAVAGETETTYINFWGMMWPITTTKETSDSVAIAVDLYNDRTTYEIDTAGIVTIDPLGKMYYYSSSNIPSLGSALGDPAHPEFMDIIKDYATALMTDGDGNTIGYSVEVCLSLEDVNPDNGTQIGIDVKINDVNNIITGYEETQIENPDYVEPVEAAEGNENEEAQIEASYDVEPQEAIENSEAKEMQTEEAESAESAEMTENGETEEIQTEDADETEPAKTIESAEPVEPAESAGPVTAVNTENQYLTVMNPVYELKKSAGIFWSHNQDSLYSDFDHEHTNSTDWGVVTLTGWNGTDEFAYSDWAIRKLLRYMDSASFAKGVYTDATQKGLDEAVSIARVIVDSTSNDRALTDRATKELKEAFAGLRWKDTKYPDPADLKKQVTLPNTYKFFGSDKMVTNNAEWEARKAEILDLAQFYEYGYKPEYDSLVIKDASYHKKGDKYMRESMSNPGTMKEDTYTDTGASITATVTVGNVSRDITYSISFPSDEAVESSGHAGKAIPIVLSFDGSIQAYLDAGFAMITVPSVCSDTRTNEYAWGKRTGLFYDLYPYVRNGEGALNEVSNEMASAWAASVVIDMLELCDKSENEIFKNAVSAVDVEKLAVTGFSINGKYAFVSGVFDDRIDVVIPGAAGATGPSPWRYVYRGQEYDWTGTAYEGAGVDSYQVAWGTEVIANSIRHNRVRETEMFRKFLTPGHFYEFEEDAYGYATRLPYDQNDLVATLAPRAIIIENTVNDYNDGCTADCLGVEIAKSVYNNLGYDADDLIKFNLRNLKTGDPHGSDNEQRGRSAQYLDYYFFGAEMDKEVDTYLSTDPYSLLISNNRTQTPYDHYWGGFNTITGGSNGVNGTDGWYYYKFPVKNNNEGNSNTKTDNSSASDTSSGNATPADTAIPSEPVSPIARPVVNEKPGIGATVDESVSETVETKEEQSGEAVETSDTIKEVETEAVIEDAHTEETVEEIQINEEETPLASVQKTSNMWLWIVAAFVIVAICGATAAYFVRMKREE